MFPAVYKWKSRCTSLKGILTQHKWNLSVTSGYREKKCERKKEEYMVVQVRLGRVALTFSWIFLGGNGWAASLIVVARRAGTFRSQEGKIYIFSWCAEGTTTYRLWSRRDSSGDPCTRPSCPCWAEAGPSHRLGSPSACLLAASAVPSPRLRPTRTRCWRQWTPWFGPSDDERNEMKGGSKSC